MQRACGPRAWTVLTLLRASGGRTQDELADRLEIGQPSVSTLLADLEDLGLVRRVSERQGRRGRPKDRWEAVDASVDTLTDVGERMIAQGKK